jgi:dihydrofolate reductase
MRGWLFAVYSTSPGWLHLQQIRLHISAMTRTQYYTASSLDGFIADANHSLDWLFQFGEEPPGEYDKFIAAIGALAMGSSTYEWLLRNHVFPADGEPRAWPYMQPTWVFSTRELQRVPGANIHFVKGDVGAVHRDMRAAADGKNIWIIGGGDLVGQFYDQQLLDEIIVDFASVTLGSGAPLLPRAIRTPPLQLRSVQQFKTHFARVSYDVVYAV